MKRFLLLNSLLPLAITTAAQKPDSLQAVALLQQLDGEHRSITGLSCHIQYTWHNASVKDSVQVIAGDVWLQPRETDSIFGQIFHLRGIIRQRGFDSYYDGQRYMEANHQDSSLLLVNPFLYPNNFSNPAKARSVLQLIQPLFFRKDLSDYLLHDFPYGKNPALALLRNGNKQVLTVAYPPNAYNASTTFTLTLQGEPLRITHVRSVVLFNGTVQTQDWALSQRRENRPETLAELTPQQAYTGYRLNELKPEKHVPYVYPLLGKTAPGFSYSGTSLEGLRGKYILLDFWETWCGYCIMAFPRMKSLYEKYHPLGLEIVGITTENSKQVEKLVELNKLPYRHINGDTLLLNNYLVSARPHYVLIGPNGQVLAGTGLETIENILHEKLNR